MVQRDAEWVRLLTAIMMTAVSEGQWKTGTFAADIPTGGAVEASSGDGRGSPDPAGVRRRRRNNDEFQAFCRGGRRHSHCCRCRCRLPVAGCRLPLPLLGGVSGVAAVVEGVEASVTSGGSSNVGANASDVGGDGAEAEELETGDGSMDARI